MFHELLAAVREEVSGERALDMVRALTRHHRVQASPGLDAASGWLAGQLEAAGLTVEVERVAADGRTRCLGMLMPQGWECTRAAAWLIARGERERLCDYDAEALSLILRSTPARGRFPVVVLEDGTDAAHYANVDVRGRVVLTRGAVHRVHQLAVVERGAAGLLFDGRRLVPPVRDAFDDPDALTYTSFWWNGDEPRGWGFVLSARRGAMLRERLRAGETLEIDVEIESRAFDTTMPLLSARLEAASGADAPEILIVSHLCHPRPSANDNASGVAAAFEAARTLAALRTRGAWASTRRGVRFLWGPELTGTYAWLAADPARARRMVAALNLDMVGEDQSKCGSSFLLEHPPHFAASFAEELIGHIRAEAVDWVTSFSGPGHYSMTRMAEVPYSGGSDHAPLNDPAIGIPCPMLIQWPDRYYHTSHDTPDKCDPASLALAARCAATYAGFLARADRAEGAWLATTLERGLKRRWLEALDQPPPAAARAAARAPAALKSLERLGATPAETSRRIAAFESFAAHEGGADAAAAATPPAAENDGARRVPVRRIGAPLEYQRHLLPGFRELPAEEQNVWRALERELPGGATSLEVAWYACDGERSLAALAAVIRVETGVAVSPADGPRSLRVFFEAAARLGLSGWRRDPS